MVSSRVDKDPMSRVLTLYETYSRQDVHDIFDPSTHFTPAAGTWGLWGIVPVRGKEGDFVLFVTFGREQAGHQFDEWITEDGVINWQSQPRQSLADRQIQQFIYHDPSLNNIYLFLRTEKKVEFTYLGRLAYHNHDPKREHPVWIQWKIIDWPIPTSVLAKMRLALKPNEFMTTSPSIKTHEFDWRGVRYGVNIKHLIGQIQTLISSGLPEEAIRFRDWYIDIEGQRVSTKWIFHLITGAAYNEFDSPTARDKLQKIGIPIYPVIDEPPYKQTIIADIKETYMERVKPMYRARYYKQDAIKEIRRLLNDLIHVGEVITDQYSSYRLSDYHYFDLVRSGFIGINPYSIVATPRLINLLPLEKANDLLEKLNVSKWDRNSWANLPEKGFHLSVPEKYLLTNEYTLKVKSPTVYEDPITRPVFLYNYLENFDDWDDWTIENLIKGERVIHEPKYFVHSVLPIQNQYGGLSEIQDAVWKTAFYWLILQLIILSDPETGVLYDPQISIHLSDGWRDDSLARVYLEGEYLGELIDCLPKLMTSFKWVWVNRNENDRICNQSCLGLLRLLLKIDIAELAIDGRLKFTDDYRRKLFEDQTNARLHYLHSKEARDKIRETIKEMAG